VSFARREKKGKKGETNPGDRGRRNILKGGRVNQDRLSSLLSRIARGKGRGEPPSDRRFRRRVERAQQKRKEKGKMEFGLCLFSS